MEDIIIKPHRSRRRYSLEIGSDGEVIVRTPLKPSQRTIRNFINGHQQWILDQQKKIADRHIKLRDWKSEKWLFFHGKKYALINSNVQSVVFESNIIHLPMHMNRNSFIKDAALNYLPERCLDIAEIMNVTVENIKIRNMKSCWGTCSTSGVIRLNTALIQVPIWVSDYVMIHECAHIVHFDHSKKFWAFVAEHCNAIKDAKKWLKEHQIVLI